MRILFQVILPSLLLLVSCKTENKDELLKGKWHLVRVFGYELTEREKGTEVEFREDGTFIRTQAETKIEAKWRSETMEDPKGDRYMIYLDRPGKDYEDELWVHDLTADSLTVIEVTQKKMVLTFARVKD